MKPAALAAVTLMASAISATNASAATLVVGGGWQPFYFGGTGSAITSPSGDTSFNFVIASAAELRVVDAFSIGDTFKLFNSGNVIGSTGAFNLGGATTTDPAIAFAGNTYSKFSIALNPGSYSISGIATASPYGGGAGYIELASVAPNPVPEPSTWAMMIAGYLLVGVVMRYRGRKLNAGYY